MNKKTLVTGAAGLLGVYLIRELLKTNEPVIAIYRSKIPPQLSLEEQAQVTWIQGDILDVLLLAEVMEDCDKVYHCAGLVSFSPKRVKDLFKINVDGTANVVNACLAAGVNKLIHVSSVASLGRKRNGQTVTENVKWDDNANPSVYGKTKYLGELEVWRGIAEGLNAVIVNPVIILGKGDWHSGSGATFKNAYNEFPWYTEGSSGFVDGEDVAKAMVMLMDCEITAERFILSAENWTYRGLFTAMAKGFGKKPPSRKVTPWLAALVWRLEAIKGWITGQDPLLTKETAETAQQTVKFDNTKILKALPGFSFKPLQQTIEESCSYYLSKM
ncbi:MAG: NAD-dependent epimerase/dehydratase family protein [Chitinophagaceae bacterium]|jgi:dihydroflavonol-4-reductase